MEQPAAELRTDWLTGRSVLVAENRALRPNDFGGEVAVATDQTTKKSIASCPFCAGNESRTPPATYEKLDSQGRWQVRVVPNMYPAVSVGVPPAGPMKASRTDVELSVPAVGAHEVILEHPSHVDRMSALSTGELRAVLEAYAERLRHWRDHGRFRYGLVFKNQGSRAGASIAHLHSQLIALPFVPSEVESEHERAAEFRQQHRACPYCRLTTQERSDAKRVVVDRDGFFAFCPFASWQPYEIWLMPLEHRSTFESATPSELERLSGVLHVLVSRLESIVPQATYNMILRTAPWARGCDDWSHWRLELLPRTNSFAGLEVATGIHINPLSPERAAEQLRRK